MERSFLNVPSVSTDTRSIAVQNPPKLPYLMDIATLAEHLGVEVRHIRRLVYERRIPFIKWGHLLRFDPVAVMAWLEECRYEPLRRAV